MILVALYASPSYGWEFVGLWGHKIDTIHGHRRGTAIHTVGSEQNNQWVSVQCVEGVQGLNIIVSIGPHTQASSTADISLALSVNGHTPKIHLGKYISNNQYILYPKSSKQIIPTLFSGDILRVGQHAYDGRTEYFNADLNGITKAVERSCSWHHNYADSVTENHSVKSSTQSSAHINNSNNGSRGDWAWVENDTGAIARTYDRESETMLSYMCSNENGADCVYVFRTEYGCIHDETYNLTLGFGTASEARARLKRGQFDLDPANNNSATGICKSLSNGHYILFEEPEPEANVLVSDMILSRMRNRNQVTITATNNAGERHRGSFSLLGSSKAIGFVNHKSDQYFDQYLKRMISDASLKQ